VKMALGINKIYCADCLDLMKEMEDNSVDLVLTDPPYGIGKFGDRIDKSFKINDWDFIPTKKYFDEIFRISKNQIIWGGNYFRLPPTKGFLIWDKEQPFEFSLAMCEMAWTSFDKPAKIFRYRVLNDKKEHPTQKALKLFEWCIVNSSKEGQTIFDPFLGSGTTAVACINTGRNFIGIEKDADYFEIAQRRIKEAQEQERIDQWF